MQTKHYCSFARRTIITIKNTRKRIEVLKGNEQKQKGKFPNVPFYSVWENLSCKSKLHEKCWNKFTRL